MGALDIYDAVLGKVITEPYLLHCAGTLFMDLGKNGIAAQLLMRCIETSPHDAEWIPDTYMNLGVALRKENHEDEAKACYKRTIEMRPNADEAWANLSGVYVNHGQPEKCIALANKALGINPKNVQARHHRALALLEAENYEVGFREYNARLKIPEFHNRSYDGPMWGGEKLDGTLVVHGEQGLGDEIMFCSLIERAKERAKKVVIECNERMIPLFERSFGVKCYKDEASVKANEKGDAWIPMGSMPAVFKITKQLEHQGYLKANPAFAEKYKKGEKLRIGLGWRGGTKMTHEHLRNFEIPVWKELIDPRFEWVSIQYGDIKDELNELGLVDTGWNTGTNGDMDEFASLVDSCDLVISVCSTAVHYAGALNKPCWVLVPSNPAWRYGTKSDKMLWYPSVKLFRQKQGEPWSEVISRVKKELETL